LQRVMVKKSSLGTTFKVSSNFISRFVGRQQSG
jgi:hypothetical protein